MDNLNKELEIDLRKKNPNICDRIFKIYMIRVNGKDDGETASNILRCPE